MKFYDSFRAPNPRRVKAFILEKGLDIPTEQVDIGKGEHMAADFSAKYPPQRLPILELDDGSILSESQAICRYLEALYPKNNLFGATALEIGQIEMWNRRVELGLLMSTALAFRHSSPFMARSEKPQVPEMAAVALTKIPAHLEELNASLAGKDYICCDRFTMADINLVISLDFIRILKQKIPDELSDLKRYHATLSQRPSLAAG